MLQLVERKQKKLQNTKSGQFKNLPSFFFIRMFCLLTFDFWVNSIRFIDLHQQYG